MTGLCCMLSAEFTEYLRIKLDLPTPGSPTSKTLYTL